MMQISELQAVHPRFALGTVTSLFPAYTVTGEGLGDIVDLL